MKIDKLTMKRLLIVKQFFNHGSIHRKGKTPLGNMLACHHFDISIETFLKVVGANIGAYIGKETKFKNLWNEVNTRYKEKYNENLPLKLEIFGIHDTRNSVQHNATVPSEIDLERFEAYTKAFLDDVLSKVFQKSLEDIKLSEVIVNKKLKQYVKEAEKLISDRNYDAALRKLSIAFDYGKKIKMKNMFGKYEFYPYWAKRNIGRAMSSISDDPFISNDLDAVLDSIQEKFELFILNIDFSQYAKFQKFKYPTFSNPDEDEFEVYDNLNTESAKKKDANFCYNFVLDFLLEIGV